MSDGQGGAGGEGGGAAMVAIAGAGGAGGETGAATPSWRDTLPDDLKGDSSLGNFTDIEALARGYIETKRTATARVEGYRTDDGLRQLGLTLRPADAADYEIPVVDEAGHSMAEAFRAFAFETGMPPQWAKGVAEFHNAQMAAAIKAEEDASQADVDAFKAQIGAEKFNAGLESVRQLLKTAGVEMAEEDITRLDAKIGSSNTLKALFHVAALVGDPAPVDGGENPGGGNGFGAMTPEQAQTRWSEVQKDPAWRAEAKKPGTPQYREYQRLNTIIAQGRAKQAAKPS